MYTQNKNSVIILQPFGLGDCIFCQGIAQHYIRGGYKVYWPVILKYIGALRQAYPQVNWIDEDFYVSDPVVRKELLHAICAPIRYSNKFMDVPYESVMKSKYDMYNIDWHTWKASAQWQRNVFKEQELMDTVTVEKYNLISTDFGSGVVSSAPVSVANGLSNVYMKTIEGYSLFDWAEVIRNATQIHFVASSNIYILEMLDLKAKEVHLYPRLPHQVDHKQYEYILEKKYILH